jgi:hypothetical protein
MATDCARADRSRTGGAAAVLAGRRLTLTPPDSRQPTIHHGKIGNIVISTGKIYDRGTADYPTASTLAPPAFGAMALVRVAFGERMPECRRRDVADGLVRRALARPASGRAQ